MDICKRDTGTDCAGLPEEYEMVPLTIASDACKPERLKQEPNKIATDQRKILNCFINCLNKYCGEIKVQWIHS